MSGKTATTGLGMIRHPKCKKNHDENTDGGTYKSEFTVTALA